MLTAPQIKMLLASGAVVGTGLVAYYTGLLDRFFPRNTPQSSVQEQAVRQTPAPKDQQLTTATKPAKKPAGQVVKQTPPNGDKIQTTAQETDVQKTGVQKTGVQKTGAQKTATSKTADKKTSAVTGTEAGKAKGAANPALAAKPVEKTTPEQNVTAKPAPEAANKADATPATKTKLTKAPRFDLVRAEPDGSTLAAGRAEPGWQVALQDQGKTIATTKADANGQWVIVLDKPLAPGAHDLSIWGISKDGKRKARGSRHIAVLVPEKAEDGVLVVASKPGENSEVLARAKLPTAQKKPEAAQKTEQVAVASPKIKLKTRGFQADEEPETTVTQRNTTLPSPLPKPQIANGAEQPASNDGKPEQTGIANVIPAPKPDQAIRKAAANKTPGTPSQSGKPVMTTPAPAQPETKTRTAAKKIATDAVKKPAPKPHVSVEAVEAEKGTIYIAGASNGPVRVYMNGKFLGEAKPGETGRWLLQSKSGLKPGKYTIRADRIGDEQGKVTARAEVPFEKQSPQIASLKPLQFTATAGGEKGQGHSGQVTIAQPQKVIIRRGDNLWTISRRIYGQGIRFSTIYQANDSQIRNPHMIFPGQVFVLPEGDVRYPDMVRTLPEENG